MAKAGESRAEIKEDDDPIREVEGDLHRLIVDGN